MPRGQNPNSLANLMKGRKFGTADDSARIAAKKASALRRNIAEEMKALLNDNDGERRRRLAKAIVDNMHKSPQWCQLGLRMIGELPPETIRADINAPDPDIMAEIRMRMESETIDDRMLTIDDELNESMKRV